MNHEGSTNINRKKQAVLINRQREPQNPNPMAQMQVFLAQYNIFPRFVLLYQLGKPVAVGGNLKFQTSLSKDKRLLGTGDQA